MPVDKDASARYPKDQTLPLADQKNMAFSSTIVLDGNAAGLVVATGMDSEIGKIAKLLQHEEKLLTPLQRRLAELSKVLGALSVDVYKRQHWSWSVSASSRTGWPASIR